MKLPPDYHAIQEKLMWYGRRNGVIPWSEMFGHLRCDFRYVDRRIEDVAYRAKNELDEYFIEHERAIPFHWRKVTVRFSNRFKTGSGVCDGTRIRISADLLGPDSLDDLIHRGISVGS